MAVPAPVSRQCSKIVKSNHPSKAWLQLDSMRREGRFTDTVLVAEGRQFPVHRLVLCACSPYFDRSVRLTVTECIKCQCVMAQYHGSVS